MTSTELVAYLRLPSLGALYKMRERGDGPRAMKFKRELLFRREDVEAWMTTKLEVV